MARVPAGAEGDAPSLAPRNPCLSPEVRTPGPRPGAPPENAGALSLCPVQRPFSSQPRLPPTLQPPQGGAPGGLRERPRSQLEAVGPGRTLGPGNRDAPGPPAFAGRRDDPRACLSAGYGSRASVSWQLPPALPPPRPPTSGSSSSPPPPSPARASSAPTAPDWALPSRSASQEPIRAEARGGAWMGRREDWARPACPWKEMVRLSGGSGGGRWRKVKGNNKLAHYVPGTVLSAFYGQSTLSPNLSMS